MAHLVGGNVGGCLLGSRGSELFYLQVDRGGEGRVFGFDLGVVLGW